MMARTRQSKYMSIAATLASEKIEDLSRWQSDNPQLCVPTGSASTGSLTANILQTTTCPSGSTSSVNYYDDINFNLNSPVDCPGGTAGCLSQTISSRVGGVPAPRAARTAGGG